MTKEITKCTAKTGGYSLTQCQTMKAAVSGVGGGARRNKKGLLYTSRVNIETGENLGTAIALHGGEFERDGIVLNLCPFCGGWLRDCSED